MGPSPRRRGDGRPTRSWPSAAASLRPADPINIQYTSGTTGFPKGATLSHRNILNNGYFIGEGCGYTPEDRVCIPVPFYHCFGMVLGNLACTTHGAAMVVPAPAFDPEATLDAVVAEQCTSLYGVPTMFIAELGLPRIAHDDLSSLRTGIMAGSPCPVEVMKQCVSQMHMDEVTICYGMTETSPVSTQTAADDPIDKRVGTVGRVHPHVEVKVVSPETGATVPRNETGELCTRGYSVMLGYWEDPERTAEAIDADGWMHTGDLAVMDDDGYLNIVGRIKDMIIRGGENVYPREIEEFLYQHPDIVDVQVIGVPDERYGEEIMAWVQVREGASLDRDAVAEFCRDRIAHYKVPRYVHVTDAFPMTVTGKVQKYLMREEAIELLGLAGRGGRAHRLTALARVAARGCDRARMGGADVGDGITGGARSPPLPGPVPPPGRDAAQGRLHRHALQRRLHRALPRRAAGRARHRVPGLEHALPRQRAVLPPRARAGRHRRGRPLAARGGRRRGRGDRRQLGWRVPHGGVPVAGHGAEHRRPPTTCGCPTPCSTSRPPTSTSRSTPTRVAPR